MPTRTLKRHDTHPMAWARLLDADGIPVNLTGCTVVYTLQDMLTLALVVTRATAQIRDQALYPGEVSYQWQAADVATARYASEEWEVTYPDGTKESFPVGEVVSVTIEADLDNT